MNEDTAIRDAVTDAILRVLRSRNDEVTLAELMEILKDYDPIHIKEAVWPLMSERAVELTSQRNLKMAKAAGAP
jgi:hypothetical protein